MIICPNCKHAEVDGAYFCSECGAQLIRYEGLKTQNFPTDQLPGLTTAPIEQESAEPSSAWISLHLLESGQILPVADRTDFTVGRVSDNQPIMPDIDLSSFKAYENGVSRLHVVIRRNVGETSIMDLGSANGTYINGVRIMPNTEQPLHHGDLVALGKLKIQIALS
jgi:hypothetical protein